MSTSGSTNFTVTTDEIITEALELLGVLGEGEDPTADQIKSSQRTLNMMAKTWQAEGLNLFAVERSTLSIVDGQESYDLGSTEPIIEEQFTGEVGFAKIAGTSEVTLINASPQFDLVINQFLGYTVLIPLVDSTVHESIVIFSSPGPSGELALNFQDVVPAGVAVGAIVTWIKYGAQVPVYGPRPMTLLEAYYRTGPTESYIPCKILSRKEYNCLTRRGTTGYINQVYYDPQIDVSTLYVWPTGNGSGTQELQLITQRTLEDFDNSDDTPDFPQEWYMPLAFNLARSLAPKYGTPQMDYARIMQQARELYKTARDFDTELETSMYLQPGSVNYDD